LILSWKFRLFALKVKLLGFWLSFCKRFLAWSSEKQNEVFYKTVDRWLVDLAKAERTLSDAE
jgi:hypothetical protein